MAACDFWAIAAREPSRLAVIGADGDEHTAGEVLAGCNRLVHGLRQHGIAPGEPIAVALTNRVELLELYFAALQAGWYFAPIHVGLTAPEIAHILVDSGARVLVFDDRSQPAVTAAARSIGLADEAMFAVGGATGARPLDDVVRGQSADSPPDRTAGDRLFYTSGTTGQPKAVRRPLANRRPETAGVAAAAHLAGVAGIAPDSGAVHLVTSPLAHSASLLWCTDHMHLGHTVVLMDRWTPEAMLDRMQRHRVTGALVVPTHFHRLLSLPDDVRTRFDPSSLRHVVHTGAPCPVDIKRRMLAWWGWVIYEVYGAAEGGGCRIGPDEWLAHPGSVGKGHGRIRVLRDDGSACAPGEIGTVYLKSGPQPFAYHNDPDKTAAARRGTFFTVGDLGRLDADDYLYLAGREADLILSGGVNVYPAEVEEVLAMHPAVDDVAVIGMPDPEWGERVVAIVVLHAEIAGGADCIAELGAHCRERLAGYKCPRTIVFVDALPRDDSGKLSRRKLREAVGAC